MEKLIFCADIHGNMSQYQRILDYAVQVEADMVVLGGDLLPKDKDRRTPAKQRDFLRDELFPLFDTFREKSDIHILLIMGNDDFSSNHALMVEGQEYHGYRMIDTVPYISKSGYIFMGYTPVPFTPFPYKCWEKRDLEIHRGFSAREGTRIEGVRSADIDLISCSLEEKLKESSIEQDLEIWAGKIKKLQGDFKKVVMVTHAPPANTVCDFCGIKRHVGSQAVRQFIEQKQPLLSLHGHIHETVDLTGSFIEKLGDSFAVAVGNDHRSESPYVIEARLGIVPYIKRLQL